MLQQTKEARFQAFYTLVVPLESDETLVYKASSHSAHTHATHTQRTRTQTHSTRANTGTHASRICTVRTQLMTIIFFRIPRVRRKRVKVITKMRMRAEYRLMQNLNMNVWFYYICGVRQTVYVLWLWRSSATLIFIDFHFFCTCAAHLQIFMVHTWR